MRKLPAKLKQPQAQAMVEFMLTLPILILLLYGIIEFSRLIFIFASVSNASRQAARYGAGSGEYDGVNYYQDCEGIRDVANRSAVITEFEEINITYDRGITPEGEQIPILDIDPDPDVDSCPIEDNQLHNGDRIIVQVEADYEPIINLLPVEPFRIVSVNARTFISTVPIFGDNFPTDFSAETSTPSEVPTSDQNTSTPTPELALTQTSVAQLTKAPLTVTSQALTQQIQTQVAAGTPHILLPTITLPPPTFTFTPSVTPRPTQTASITPTAISCTGLTGVSHGPLEYADNVLRMAISNDTGHVLTAALVYVEWNHDTGHNGNDTGLVLEQVKLSGQTWNGSLQVPSAFITSYYPRIPTGLSYINFQFNQNYDIKDGTERIIITIGTPGCVNYPVDSSK